MKRVLGRDWPFCKVIIIVAASTLLLARMLLINTTLRGQRRLLPVSDWGFGRRPLFEAEDGRGRHPSSLKKIGSITKYGVVEVVRYDSQP